MNPREWALVAFTLLMQTSVGVLLVAALLQPFVSRGSPHAPARLFDLPLTVAAGAALVALLASLFHLGHPLDAWLALTNVRTSWLSREIVFAASFTAVAVLLAAVSHQLAAAPALHAGAWIAAAIFGLACILSMARLYMVPAQPAWHRLLTPASFLATTVVLGACVCLACLLLGGSAGEPSRAAAVHARWLTVAAIMVLGVQLLLLPAQLSALARDPSPAMSVGAATWLPEWLAVGRAIAALAAIFVLARVAHTWPAAPPAVVVAGVVLVLASEILGRVLFYAGGVRLF